MTEISKIKIDNNDLLIKDAIARSNIESLSTNINNYLPLTGGNLNGNLNLTANNDKTLSSYLRLYSGNGFGFIQARSSSTDYQSNLLVQGGGNLLIGSGESCHSMWSNNIQNAANNTENLFLNSDSNIYINTNVQTTTAVKTWTFNNSGNAVFPGSLTLNTPLTQQNGGTGVATATANKVFASPDGSNGTPSFRALKDKDLPYSDTAINFDGTLWKYDNNCYFQSGYIYISRCGKFITMSSYSLRLSKTIDTGTIMAKMPTEYLPNHQINTYVGNSSCIGQLLIQTDGDMYFYPVTGPFYNSSNMNFTVTYLAKNY